MFVFSFSKKAIETFRRSLKLKGSPFFGTDHLHVIDRATDAAINVRRVRDKVAKSFNLKRSIRAAIAGSPLSY